MVVHLQNQMVIMMHVSIYITHTGVVFFVVVYSYYDFFCGGLQMTALDRTPKNNSATIKKCI